MSAFPLGILALGVVLLPACGDTSTEPPGRIDSPAALLLSTSRLALSAGDTLRVRVTLVDASGEPVSGRLAESNGGAGVAWYSSNTAVAAVDGAGLVEARQPGDAVITASAGTLSSTSSVAVRAPRTLPVSTVVVAPGSATLSSIGSAVELSATVLDVHGDTIADPSITWSSQDPQIASVDSAGRVVSRAAGNTLITAVSGKRADSSSVQVRQVIASVTLSRASVLLEVGASLQLTAAAADSNDAAVEGAAFGWASSDPAVVTVGSSGVVKAVAAGSASVSATAQGVTGTAAVTVVDAITAAPPAPPRPVFPGAEGFGTTTRAAYGLPGRPPAVMRVTNLNATGAGSLRAAIEAAGPRVVVFEVSGTIWTTATLAIRNPYITIAGQTAPSPGITIAGAVLQVRTHDVLVQHLRVRPGDDPAGSLADGRDAITIMDEAYNVVIDRNSFSWGIDENGSTSSATSVRDITFSNNIFSEGLSNSIHSAGEHSKGFLLHDRSYDIALIGNLIAHNRQRNPAAKGATSSITLNNLVYNPGTDGISFSDASATGRSYSTVVGNVIIPGPSSVPDLQRIRVDTSLAPGSELYLEDNAAPNVPADPWDLVTWWPAAMTFTPRVPAPPVWLPDLTVRPSGTVEAHVLAHAGARAADRDAVDARIINEVRTRTGRIIDSPSEVGGWPTLAAVVRPLTLPETPHADSNRNGYTDLEEWLHLLAAQVEGR